MVHQTSSPILEAHATHRRAMLVQAYFLFSYYVTIFGLLTCAFELTQTKPQQFAYSAAQHVAFRRLHVTQARSIKILRDMFERKLD